MKPFLKILHEFKPAMVLVLAQVLFAGLNVFYKLAVEDGMNLRIIIAYRFLFGTVFMIPLALLVERNRPKMTWTILIQGFFCALLGHRRGWGSLAQNLYIESMALTSATFICAMTNLSPALTFIIAIIIGLEKLAIKSMAGKAKVLGTLIGIGGGLVLTLYKGPQFNISTSIDLLPNGHHDTNHSKSSHNHLLGALLVFICCICYAIWMNLQAKLSERYPCYYSCTALTCMCGSIQSVVFALCMERDMSQWKLGWNIRLLAVAYAGIFGMGIPFSMMAWSVRIKGPLYTSVFNPLVLILVAIAGSLFLEEKLTLGTIIGAVLIVIGLYAVLWGKGKELKKNSQLVPSTTSPEDKDVEIVVTSYLDDKTSVISNDNSVIVFSADEIGRK